MSQRAFCREVYLVTNLCPEVKLSRSYFSPLNPGIQPTHESSKFCNIWVIDTSNTKDVVISTIQKSSQKTVSLKKFHSVHHKQIISNSNDLSRQINCRISILINSEICLREMIKRKLKDFIGKKGSYPAKKGVHFGLFRFQL